MFVLDHPKMILPKIKSCFDGHPSSKVTNAIIEYGLVHVCHLLGPCAGDTQWVFRLDFRTFPIPSTISCSEPWARFNYRGG